MAKSFKFNYGDTTVLVNDIQTAVPIPATALLFGTGLAGLIGLRRRKRDF
ncbi:MAG: VPLPA-CTERM sorting domain-containing protein [Desulfamplus sp.]|nr:VPLPA-CTERM sorting domain-containing protein [Desulfamplus sp.]